MTYQMDWQESTTIKAEHSHLEITQVYGWLVTTDNNVIIVSKDNQKWQFPGGHPNPGEDNTKTLTREIYEETNIDIKPYLSKTKLFGYYTVKEFDGDILVKSYLQLRFLIPLNTPSDELVLKTNENVQDTTAIIKFVKPVVFSSLDQYISWLPSTGEYKTIKSILNL